MSIKSRLAKLEKAISPPGKCRTCGQDKHSDAISMTIIGCSDKSCRCHGADPYDVDVFEQTDVAPKCPECGQHRGCSLVECIDGRERAKHWKP